MKKSKILMLGWEFPPAISGGLGIAFYGICKSLASKCDLNIIVPRMDKSINIPDANLLSIGDLDIDTYFEGEEIKILEKVIREEKIQIEISPYPVKSVSQPVIKKTEIKVKRKPSDEVYKVHRNFMEAELYGNDVVNMVRYFSEITDMIASRLSFDIIHAHDWMTFNAGIRLKDKYHKPLLLHVHSLNFDRVGPSDEGWVYRIEKEAFKAADLIIPVSNYTGSILMEHYQVDKKKIFPIHNGIDPIRPFKTEKKFPEKLILFLGRITLQKGPEYFLETASKVIDKYPEVRFAIAGTGDQLNQVIEEGAHQKISHKLHFTGFLDRQKVHSLLSMADLFCMPSVSEPFGLTALEAVQFGIPVIISKKSGVAEVLPSALLADFWDTDLMAEQILSLLKNRKLYNKKVRDGKRDVEKLSWDSATDKILMAYKKVLV
jgi:glycogen(starch) synthase